LKKEADMAEIKDLIQSADWKKEKHVPVIDSPDSAKKGEAVKVTLTVGKEIPHPNTTAHHIRWIAVYFLAYNLVRWAMAKAALLADVLPRILSFAGAKRLLCTFADQLRRTSGDQVRTLIETVTACIATLRLPHRPDRIEPRAKKRRPKNLPLLTMPRQVARDLIYAQRELNRVP